jgi:hypothetical protein
MGTDGEYCQCRHRSFGPGEGDEVEQQSAEECRREASMQTNGLNSRETRQNPMNVEFEEVSLLLSGQQLSALEKEASTTGVTVGQLLRSLIRAYLVECSDGCLKPCSR